MTMLHSVVQLLFGGAMGVASFGLGRLLRWLVDRAGRRQKTVTFELRSRQGKLLTTMTIPKNPTPEQERAAREEIRRVGTLAQQH